ncbi:hypothetical protein [Halorubrum miltondacostae]|uniref:Uncharacterized protein n=1 Tax=Halorubrum miltondacostae TaxID=3076378 RepID=A0ABD5M4F8_9EURY
MDDVVVTFAEVRLRLEFEGRFGARIRLGDHRDIKYISSCGSVVQVTTHFTGDEVQDITRCHDRPGTVISFVEVSPEY